MNQKILFSAFFLLFFIAYACGNGTPPEKKMTAPTVEVNDKKEDSPEAEAAKMVKLGAKVYKQFCISCHGADGKLGVNGAGDLTASVTSEVEVMTIIQKGKGLMTPFEELLNDKQIEAVTGYVMNLRGEGE